MSVYQHLFAYERERIPNVIFHLMSALMAIRDRFAPVDHQLNSFNIEKGDKVVDFGCGPGSYVERASLLVGDTGTVYAVDLHPLAIDSVKREIERRNLSNVVPILSNGIPVSIEDTVIDVVYAMDMFHHIKDTTSFLAELKRMLKPSGMLYIQPGHQSMKKARQKILEGGAFQILQERKTYFVCRVAV